MIYSLFAMLMMLMATNIVETYRLTDNHLQLNESDEDKLNNLNHPELIDRLEKLHALLAVLTGEHDERFQRESSRLPEHLINTRLAANRRPGLLRLKKNSNNA